MLKFFKQSVRAGLITPSIEFSGACFLLLTTAGLNIRCKTNTARHDNFKQNKAASGWFCYGDFVQRSLLTLKCGILWFVFQQPSLWKRLTEWMYNIFIPPFMPKKNKSNHTISCIWKYATLNTSNYLENKITRILFYVVFTSDLETHVPVILFI